MSKAITSRILGFAKKNTVMLIALLAAFNFAFLIILTVLMMLA